MAICTNPFRAASATPVFSSLHKEGKREVDNAPSAINLRTRSEEHTSELQSRQYLVCRLLLEKKPRHNLDRSCKDSAIQVDASHTTSGLNNRKPGHIIEALQ